MDVTVPFEKTTARAISLGASCVGAVPVAKLLESPSHRLYPVDRRAPRDGTIVVLALAHPDAQPEMDWWSRHQDRTPGNRMLINISRRLKNWLAETYAAEACALPYHSGQSGIFLKDAAVLAGLGVLGPNNLLITPEYGPRVRLRAMLLNIGIEAPGPLDDFAPCDECDRPCLEACPTGAFQDGCYQRERCRLQMKADETEPIVRQSPVIGMPPEFMIDYCRRCELACPVGQP